MTLLVDGSAVSGTGVFHIEAGPDQPFTVTGTSSQIVLTFTAIATTETFAMAQPDANHLQLTDSNGTLHFVRER
jgi:hypothetical protein